jgi:hypothetical protein
MSKFNGIVLINVLLLITSCATIKVKNSGTKTEPVKSIILFSTMIGRIQQPVLPLIDAAAFNEKTNSIADQIMDLQKQTIDNYREIISNSLKKHFNCEVFSAASLHSIPEFSELKAKHNYSKNLRVDNNHFPQIIIGSDDINPFQFENGKIIQYFKEPGNYKQIISEINTMLKSDLVAVSYSQLSVIGAGMFGAWGNLRLDTYIYLFDKDGVLVTEGHTWSKQANISGRELQQYKYQLDNLSWIIEPLMIKIAGNY